MQALINDLANGCILQLNNNYCAYTYYSSIQTVPFPVYEALQVQVKSLETPICSQSAFGSHGLGEHGSRPV